MQNHWNGLKKSLKNMRKRRRKKIGSEKLCLRAQIRIEEDNLVFYRPICRLYELRIGLFLIWLVLDTIAIHNVYLPFGLFFYLLNWHTPALDKLKCLLAIWSAGKSFCVRYEKEFSIKVSKSQDRCIWNNLHNFSHYCRNVSQLKLQFRFFHNRVAAESQKLQVEIWA